MLHLLSPARRRWMPVVLVALALVMVAGAGWLVVAVQADWKPPSPVKPYDPLQSW